MKRELVEKYTALPRSVKVLLQAVLDVISVFAAYTGSLLVRFGAEIPTETAALFTRSIIPIVLIYILFFNAFALYRSFWETTISEEFFTVTIASVGATASVDLLMLIFSPEHVLPQSVYLAGGTIVMVLVGYSRLYYRVMRRMALRMKATKLERAMIIGAGETGDMVIRQLIEMKSFGVQPVIVIDDDKKKLHKRVQGIRVAGNRNDIPELAKKYLIDIIIFCLPSAGGDQKREILKICTLTKCKIRTVPGLDEIMHNGDLTRFRKIKMADLLPRPEIKINVPGVREYISGKTVLVTGGGGSIGSELCRQIAALEPQELVIFDIYENNAYELQLELQHKYPGFPVTVEIGSVRDRKRLDDIFISHRPDVVFHAAAHKHVPLMEANPAEAVNNNVFGTLNTAEAADRFNVKRFVLISTDKAVHPSSVMGATKQLDEQLIQYMNTYSKTQFVAVRFGNVLGSNGSVIPIFQKQIENGGPVTVTHRDITRYFMTIPEAVQLVLQAGSLAQKGEIFILDMGAPVRIDDVARSLIRLSGYEPDVDIKIEYTGLRPGEKLFEELFLDEEKTEKTELGGILVGCSKSPSPDEVKRNLEWLREQIDADADVRKCLQAVLKTYHPAPVLTRDDEDPSK